MTSMRDRRKLRGVRAASITVLMAAVLVGGGASSGGSAAAEPPRISKERAIRVALAKLLNHPWFRPFPRTVGRVRCEIPVGGINAGSTFPGFCQTRVSIGRTYVTVAFTQVWGSGVRDADPVHGSNGPLTHTWIVIESKRLKALDIATFGDFPPQWVR